MPQLLRNRYFFVVIILVLAFATSSAFAGAKIFHSVVRQAGGFTLFSGTYESNENGNTDPFVVQIFSSGTECVRLEVVFQSADMEMTLISPTGTIWQNDDGDASGQPLLKVITDVRGWYPLVVSHFNGTSLISDFDIQYGRFPSTSEQCVSPTPPRAAWQLRPERNQVALVLRQADRSIPRNKCLAT